MPKLAEKIGSGLGAIGVGLLWAAAFPKLGVASLAWLAPAGLLLAAAGWKRPFLAGYVGGLVFWLVSIHWLLFIPVPFYPILGWVALSAFAALYSAAWVWLCCRALGPRRGSGSSPLSTSQHEKDYRLGADGSENLLTSVPNVHTPRMQLPKGWGHRLGWALFCAASWVALEMIQARLFSGFPWNLLGTSQYQMLPLLQVASVTGVYGVSFLIVWVSVSLWLAGDALWRNPSHRLAWSRDFLVPLLALALLATWGLRRTASLPPPARVLKLALIQPSIPQAMIWDDRASAQRFRQLLELSEAALATRPDLLVWPEAAVPKLLCYDREVFEPITNLVRTHGVWMICGADDVELRPSVPGRPAEPDYFNASFLISPRGELVATYRKRKLVIFGEYVPLADWLPFLKRLTPITGSFTAGPGPVPFVAPELGIRTATLICFEDIFPHTARESAGADLDFLLNLTNDGWFGEGAAQWQQAAASVFRAIENDLPLVRCANNGLTCWVDARGGLHEIYFGDSGDIYGRGFKTALIPLRPHGATRASTFYHRHGDWFGWACVAVCAAGWAAAEHNKRSRPAMASPPLR